MKAILSFFLILLLRSAQAAHASAPAVSSGQLAFVDNKISYQAPSGTVFLLTFEDRAGAASVSDITGQVAATSVGSPAISAVPGALPAGAFPTGFALNSADATNYVYLSAAAKGGRSVPYCCSRRMDFDYWRTSNTATTGTAGRFWSFFKDVTITSTLFDCRTTVAGSANNGAISITARVSGANGTSSAPYLLVAGEWFHFSTINNACLAGSWNSAGFVKTCVTWVYRYSTSTWTQVQNSLSPGNVAESDITGGFTVGIGYNTGTGATIVMTPGFMTNFMEIQGYWNATVAPALPVFRRSNYSLEFPRLFNFPLVAYR